jgi:nucleotide-binding universal stress UspA family protein
MVETGTAAQDGFMPTMLKPPHAPPAEQDLARLTGPVVVGFDGSASAVRGLELAATALAPGTRLLVVAVEPDVHSRGLLAEPLLGPRGRCDGLLSAARRRLRAYDDRLRLETFALRGDPATVLVDLARHERAKLLVIGGRGRDFEARVLLGSVAARVVQVAPCDVLVVR